MAGNCLGTQEQKHLNLKKQVNDHHHKDERIAKKFTRPWNAAPRTLYTSFASDRTCIIRESQHTSWPAQCELSITPPASS